MSKGSKKRKRKREQKRAAQKHHASSANIQRHSSRPKPQDKRPKQPRQNKPKVRKHTVKQEAIMLLQHVMWEIQNYEHMNIDQIYELINEFDLAWSVLQEHVKHEVVKT